MPSNTASSAEPGITVSAPDKSNIRWFVCALLFAATTINYMDRSVFSLIEPLLHNLPFMGWNFASDPHHQPLFDNNYGNVIICFQIAYGVGFLFAGRIIDKLGTKTGYALAIAIWALSSMSHSLVPPSPASASPASFLGLGESGNFPAAIKATTEWFPTEERAIATGIFNSGSSASFFLAPLLIAFVTAHYGWRAAFLATGSMGLMLARRLAALPLQPPPPRLHPDPDQPRRRLRLSGSYGGNHPLLRPAPPARASTRSPSAKASPTPSGGFTSSISRSSSTATTASTSHHAYWYIVTVYVVSTVGSIFGGWLSGFLMSRGYWSTPAARSPCCSAPSASFRSSSCRTWVVLFPTNAWPATLLIALATAAHQGWSANLFSTPTDMFPSTAVSTIVGIGGAVGALGGAAFTWIVKHNFSLHPCSSSPSQASLTSSPSPSSNFSSPAWERRTPQPGPCNTGAYDRDTLPHRWYEASARREALRQNERGPQDQSDEATGHSQLTMQVVDHVRSLISQASSHPAIACRPSANSPANSRSAAPASAPASASSPPWACSRAATAPEPSSPAARPRSTPAPSPYSARSTASFPGRCSRRAWSSKPTVASLAAERATDEHIAELAEEVAEMYASLADPHEYLIHDVRFHRTIARAAGNPILAALMETITANLYDDRSLTVAELAATSRNPPRCTARSIAPSAPTTPSRPGWPWSSTSTSPAWPRPPKPTPRKPSPTPPPTPPRSADPSQSGCPISRL